MNWTARRILGGPNVHALFPVFEGTLDLGPLEERPTDTLPGFAERLLAAVPGLERHACSEGGPGGFVRRLERGTWLGHVVEHVALALQEAVGADVSFGRTRGTGSPGIYRVVFAVEDPAVGLVAGDAALRVVLACLDGPASAEVDRFHRETDRVGLGPSAMAVVRAAAARSIPWRRLDDRSLVQLGHGVHQQRIAATLTGRTSCLAVDLAADKALTRRLLAEAGLPVPEQRVVTDADEAARAAEALGGDVVVKPRSGNHGRGVTVGGGDVRRAFARALAEGGPVLVERRLPGQDHRLLVVGDAMVAAARRRPAHVVGDGLHTVEELVARANADPRRGEGHARPLTRLVVDPSLVDPGEVPGRGVRVDLATTANLSTGGDAVDVTDLVHPDNRGLAVRAARILGLDVAGVDLLIPDVSRSWREVGGGICEVNAAPGLRMHLAPTEGEARDVAGPIVDHLFPEPVRLPVVALTGTNGKTTTARIVAHLLRAAGRRVGLASTEGVWVHEHWLCRGDLTGPTGARMVLQDPTVEHAVLEVARGGLLRAGMGAPDCDVGALLNVSNDHLGYRGVRTVQEMAWVKGVVVESARSWAVLNAADPSCRALAERCRAPVCGFGGRLGDRSVVLADGQVVLESAQRRVLLGIDEVPATLGGLATHNVENVLAAVAIGWCSGLDPDLMAQALRTFTCDWETLPGRLNVHDRGGVRVILDYGHNEAAFRAMAALSRRIPVAGARRVVLASPGNRQDLHIRAAARGAAPGFDHFVVREDDDPRDRTRGEVAALLRAGVLEAGAPPDAVEVVLDERAAVRRVLDASRPGDLVVVFGTDLARTWRQITGAPDATNRPPDPVNV